MLQSIIQVSLVVREYDEAIHFFCNLLHFEMLENFEVPEQKKRWVVIAPKGSKGTRIVLGRAVNAEQKKAIGNQTGGRVFLSLHTDDFWRDYKDMVAKGIRFVREPKEESYGTVAVFKDLYGNLWDLIHYSNL